MSTPPPSASSAVDSERIRLERDLFLRLLQLGAQEDVRPFLEEALALVTEVTEAGKGYIEMYAGEPRADGAPRFSIARGFTDEEIARARHAISTGIIAEALATGQTISTASAFEDPRFRNMKSVKAQRIQAVLCAPVGGSIPLGVLYLSGRAAPGPFSEVHRAYAELLARHIAPLADRLLVREEVASRIDFTLPYRAKLAVANVAGTSRALAEVFRQLAVAAPVPISVLFTGESGTGKTALARALHASSPRASGPFVDVNATAIPEQLFESELFGAEKGAHSTATRRVEGKVDAARGGTLFLDEIGEIPLSVQGKLLQFLQSKRYFRLGSTAPIEADVRVLAATNADLEDLVATKRFREDLYYRLNVLEVRVPPLRDRREDIGAIATSLVEGLGRHGEAAVSLSRAARVALREGEWPGNVRQLENALQRGWAVALSESSSTIEPRHLFPERRETEGAAEVASYEDATRHFQRGFLREALHASGWNVSETARKIGLSRSHLNDLIRVHGLVRTKA